ncbi:DNA helicase UvrD [Flavonifractor sp. An92]|uniref:ATP-dependent helicase n=1 Tax=Flavonifractor sp. An92 TaxID=1965666 RepID=UPI000B3A902C|nr:UvrD-helicase domain-containing protein [Flavonifractor sp. An92]OUN07597.1 DNA helicase UvrD [Flavonifractor sp. An92]
MTDYLEGLNGPQRQAVTTTEGYVRLVAGAGSGKTRALARRFAYLVEEAGILPGNILCVTFTNKSANEMRQRIHALTGDQDTGYVCTFHSFCVSVLQEDSHVIQYPKSFLVLDNADIDAMLAILYEERGLTLRDMTFRQARDMIEVRKLFENPEYYRDVLSMDLEQLHQKYLDATAPRDILFFGYLYQEKKCFALDYNDLIVFTLYLFEQNEAARQKWQERLEYIMIDEFQDIDQPQYRLMEVLCGYHRNLFVVGDPDQTIYTWRGADVRYLLDFPQKFPGTETILMMENYRSTPQILAAANSLISRNKARMEKNLIPRHPDGQPVLCRLAGSEEEEAGWICGQILALRDQGVPLRDIAVLYRAHYLTRTVEEVFLKAKLPYAITSGAPFFQRKEIKDALSYLRLIAYRDDLSFLRVANVPRRNLGERRMGFLKEQAAARGISLYQTMLEELDGEVLRGSRAADLAALVEDLGRTWSGRPVSEVLAQVLDRSGYETMLRTEGSQERLDNLAELKQSVYEYETTCGEEATLEHYLAHVALFTNQDVDDGREAVRLMTVHAAKGLEFPYVFLCGLNEGVFPSKKVRTLEGMEEERRLAFVALTRAQKGLYLSAAGGRNFDGSPKYPSRFLLDIDPKCLTFDGEVPEEELAEARRFIHQRDARLRPAEEQVSRFQAGDRVRHGVFGTGTVLGVDPERGCYQVQFDDMRTPRAITFRAKLEREA